MRKIVVIVCSVFLCLFAANISWSASWLIEENTQYVGYGSEVWEKDFSLPAIPSEIEYLVLMMDTVYSFSCSPLIPPKIYINDILIGSIPGSFYRQVNWVPYTFVVQSHVFQEGTNSIRIEAPYCGNYYRYYDFTFRDVKLIVNNWQENSRHGN